MTYKNCHQLKHTHTYMHTSKDKKGKLEFRSLISIDLIRAEKQIRIASDSSFLLQHLIIPDKAG